MSADVMFVRLHLRGVRVIKVVVANCPLWVYATTPHLGTPFRGNGARPQNHDGRHLGGLGSLGQ